MLEKFLTVWVGINEIFINIRNEKEPCRIAARLLDS